MSNVIESWQYYKERTNNFLQLLTDDDLNYKPLESLKTLGHEFRHLADVRDIYLRSIEQGEGASWTSKRKNHELETSKEKLVAEFETLDQRLDALLANEVNLDHIIPWEEMGNPTVSTCIEYMRDHELLHQGLWIAYIKGLQLDFDISE